MTAISIRNVKKRYGKADIIHGVDLEIQAGEFIVILGPSGCGKSTLLRMIAGLEEITAGEIAIEDRVVNQLEPRERGCAMVFQNYALYPHMTVAGNIGYALKVAGMAKPQREERVLKVAQSVGLEALLARRPGELSGGQRQRVAMARAMVREPKVFLFDEPFSNLDAKLRVAMRGEVRRLHRQLGVTSIFVTHDQTEAMTLADRLVIMNGGHVEQVGKPAEIYNRPVSRFVADFIGSPAMNLLEGEFDAEGHFVHGQGGRIAVSSLNGHRVPGRKIVLGIRPEAVKRTIGPQIGTIPGIVDYVEELGGSRLIHAEVNGNRLVALDTDTEELSSGTPVHFTFDDALHAFSIEDGKRIDIHPA
ncbi:sn-glycerol-3-phosphate ABC transporter ATP-binding protein UgpC [Rhizobium sp. LC145]|uniref:ABC transporter ATP-binding protein n=1 Tax=Rhizobium sp. LC145 TaxID=1120688 RepID=UPI00062A4229|nr:sn-glycerol-3-phosphate ABC transporter ATP-binding protein UgpC [Rhizobium sp. LC145]KKX31701.1 glycerol-3-phosphate ABC transporter ATP-binding protein [Rhizobium sp. LC145]TKT59892.1 sn-glycerol-3-phosphate ABC transporter ATP-binding protein UgpC [Rhizobiaceae bacterium LC148]